MKKEIKSALKKTTKIACVTCLAAGTVAIVTSSAALKAIGEGGKYLVNTVKKIVKEKPETGNTPEAAEEDFSGETATAAREECVCEADFAEEEVIAEEAPCPEEAIES